MGIWDFINSTTDLLKRNAPNLGVNDLQKVNQYMPNDEARAKIALFVTKLGKNAADYAVKEGVKSIPGGKAVTTIFSQTINDMKSENFKRDVEFSFQKAPYSDFDF